MREGGHLSWRRIVVLLVGALAAACSDAPDWSRPGLTRLPGSPSMGPSDATGAPHLGELAVAGGAVYAANEWFGVATWRAEGLALTDGTPVGDGVPRCTTLALHAPSHTLYCSAADGRKRLPPRDDTVVALYDVANAQHPRLRAHAYLPPQATARDLHVVGDELFVGAFGDGLLRFRIAADGSIGEAERVADGDVRVLAGEGDVLLALDRDRGLRRFARGAAGWTETGRLALDGPAMDLVLHGTRAVAALGSAGVAVVDVAEAAPRLVRTLDPECAATSADLQGELLGVVCFGAARLFDLASEPPRPRGLVTPRRVFLQGRFGDGTFFVNGWHELEALGVDPKGELRELELPRGSFTRPGDDVHLVVRNPGLRTIQASLGLGSLGQKQPLPGISVLPQSTQEVVVPGALLQQVADPQLHTALLSVGSRLEGESEERTHSIVLALQDPAHVDGGAFPAVGDLSPHVQVMPFEGSPLDVPSAAAPLWLVFYAEDCSAMWHELEDLAWLARSGLVPGGRVPLFIEHTSHARDFVARWRLDGALHGFYDSPDPEIPDAVHETNRPYAPDLHEGAFAARAIGEGIDNSTDVWVDTDGRIAFLGRVYRGKATP